MKIDLNDPRITAFALGELTGDDAIELARAVRMDGRVSQAVDEARDTAQLLSGVLSVTGAEMLTSAQRSAIRSAGSSPVIEDIASARVPFWKKPAVVATGVAAGVAATLYIVGGDKPADNNIAADQNPEWNWTQVETRDLTAPVTMNDGVNGIATDSSDAARAVSSAMSDDTDGFRSAVRERIESSEIKTAERLPELDAIDWQDIATSERISIPLSSGASSWPWIKRYIIDADTLPPKKAVRIEEMINHFSYSKPSMIKQNGLAADLELCRNPWNPQTYLLAVNLQSQPGADVAELSASLVIDSDRVRKMRLLGYANPIVQGQGNDPASSAVPPLASRTRGNFVIYELQIDAENSENTDLPMVTLTLGGGAELSAKDPKTWVHASADLRFASVIAATGMILSDYPSPGELNTARLVSLVDLIEKSAAQSLPAEREKALELVRKALGIVEKGTND